MDLYKIIKREPEKKSGWEIFLKVLVVVSAVAATGLLVMALYKKWKECTAVAYGEDNIDDEWFCDCDECSDEDNDGDFEPECVCECDESQAEVEYEEKEDEEI